MFCILKWGCEYSYHSCVNNCSSAAAGMKFLLSSDLEGKSVMVTLSIWSVLYVSEGSQKSAVSKLIFQMSLFCASLGDMEQIARDVNLAETEGGG